MKGGPVGKVLKAVTSGHVPPLIRIDKATFFRQQPSATTSLDGVNHNPPLYPDLTFELPAKRQEQQPLQNWAVLGHSSGARTAFLHILRGRYLSFPPTARSYPFLASEFLADKDAKFRSPSKAFQYVGFDAERGAAAGGGLQGAYLSARYESRREITDFSLIDYLSGNTELNADESMTTFASELHVEEVARSLKLDNLLEMPVTQLSNGQTRRARIAKALLGTPELILLDGPFMGLDPPTVEMLAGLLHGMAETASPRLILSLNPGEFMPDWINHLAVTDQQYHVHEMGPRPQVFETLKVRAAAISKGLKNGAVGDFDTLAFLDMQSKIKPVQRVLPSSTASIRYRKERRLIESGEQDNESLLSSSRLKRSTDGFLVVDPPSADKQQKEALVEMDGVRIAYGERIVLGGWMQSSRAEPEDLHWTVRRGERWGLFGQNGSGKTTLLALMTSDHPQAYSQPIKLFGRHRLPEAGKPGISVFDIQSRIGHSSPEVHAFFPKHLSLRRVIESAWADTPIIKPRLTVEIDAKVDAVLRWFRGELNPALGHVSWMVDEMKRPRALDYKWALASKGGSNSWAGAKLSNSGGVSLAAVKALHEDEEMASDFAWADELTFGELSFSAQRVALFLRAIINQPDLVILDEAFSGMDSAARDKCHAFLSHGETKMLRYFDRTASGGFSQDGPTAIESDTHRFGRVKVPGLQESQALVVISHKKEEIPGCIREWICLPEPGNGVARSGRLAGPLQLSPYGWEVIWGSRDDERPVVDPSIVSRWKRDPQDIVASKALREKAQRFLTQHSIGVASFARAIGVVPHSLAKFLGGENSPAAEGGLTDCFAKPDPLATYVEKEGISENLRPVAELQEKLTLMTKADPSLRSRLAKEIGIHGKALGIFMDGRGGGWQLPHQLINAYVSNAEKQGGSGSSREQKTAKST